MVDILGKFAQGMAMGEDMANAQKRRRLSEFFQQAYTAPKADRQRIVGQAMGIDPQAGLALDQQLGKNDDVRNERLVGMARVLTSAPEQVRDGLYQQMKPDLQAMGIDVSSKPTYDEQVGEIAKSLVNAYAPSESIAPRVVGNALVDASGRVLYQGQDERKIIGREVADDGTLYLLYSDGSYAPARMGGGPQMAAPSTGGGGAVLEDAVSSAITPYNGRITSTTGGRHNPGSKHYSGNAIDVGMGRESPEQQARIIAALQADPSLMVRDERTRPAGQAVWGGPHVHVERRGQDNAPRATGPTFGNRNKTEESFQQLSPAEVQALGLPQGTVAQRSTKTGKVDIVNKPDARPGTGGLSADETKKVRADFTATKGALDQFKALDQALESIPNGISVLTDGAAKGRLGTAYNNARASLRILYDTGVLQPGELPMLESALRDPTTFSAVIDPRSRPQMRAQLDELYRAVARSIELKAKSYPQLFDPQKYEQKKAELERAQPQQQTGPRRVANEADYNALPSGAVYITPDGVTRRKK